MIHIYFPDLSVFFLYFCHCTWLLSHSELKLVNHHRCRRPVTAWVNSCTLSPYNGHMQGNVLSCSCGSCISLYCSRLNSYSVLYARESLVLVEGPSSQALPDHRLSYSNPTVLMVDHLPSTALFGDILGSYDTLLQLMLEAGTEAESARTCLRVFLGIFYTSNHSDYLPFFHCIDISVHFHPHLQYHLQ